MISWWRRRPLLFRDGVPGLIALVGGLVGVFVVDASLEVWPIGVVTAIAAGAAIIVRRARPSLGFVLALASTVVAIPAQFEAGTDVIAAVLCGYTVVAYRSRFSPGRALLAMLGTAAVAMTLSIPFFDQSAGDFVANAISLLLLAILTVGLGNSVRTQRLVAEELAERNTELVELRQAEADRAIAEERTRIARELHDLVAHHVSAMVVTARAGARSGRDLPPATRDALQTVVASGTEALDAMRRLVAVLRSSDDDAELHPQPDLGEIVELVDSFRRVGLRVDLDMASHRNVAGATGLTAYRIVQESLTNVLRHAGTRRAWVTVAQDGGALVVTVDDDGTTADPALAPTTTGHGLVGMRERAALAEGRVDLSRSPYGGWRVRAHLPVAASPTAAQGYDDGAGVVPWRRVS